jgi:hypothetical protein
MQTQTHTTERKQPWHRATTKAQPSAKVMAALKDCARAIGRDRERQREHYLFLRKRFTMAADEGLTYQQIASIVKQGCKPHFVGRVVKWQPDKTNTPYAGDYAKRAGKGNGQFPDQKAVIFGRLSTGRVKLDLVTWTAATKLMELDVTMLTALQRREAVEAATHLLLRLHSTDKPQ